MSYDHKLLQCYVLMAVWTPQFLTYCVRWKLNVPLTKVARHFKVILRLTESDSRFAFRATYFLAEVLDGRPDMNPTRRTSRFEKLFRNPIPPQN